MGKRDGRCAANTITAILFNLKNSIIHFCLSFDYLLNLSYNIYVRKRKYLKYEKKEDVEFEY